MKSAVPTTIRLAWSTALVGLLLAIAPGRTAFAEDPPGLAVAAALEQSLVQAIGSAEKSVVAVARVRRDLPGESVRIEMLPDPFALRQSPLRKLNPSDPNFVPNEYGAGVVVDRRGLIVTSYSMVTEESDYYVTTSERHIYKAWVKAADPRSDLAMLAIDGAEVASLNLTPVQFGDAGVLRKGQMVLTLGNPHAIAHDGQASAAWGIVANLARKTPAEPEESDPTGKRSLNHFGTLIQTDIRLHEGAGGGPLINLRGEMVGLCIASANTAGGETSNSLAIPVDATFRRAIDTLKQGREVEYGFLGIQPMDLRSQESIAGLHGTRVQQIWPGTPAARYGLRNEDIITMVNNRPVYDADGLVLEVGRLPVESVAHLTVLRNGAKQEIDVTLSKYPVRGRKIITMRPTAWRGLRIDYPSALLDADSFLRGSNMLVDDAVAVTEVDANTLAAQSGMKQGMLISEVDGQSVRTPKEFLSAIEQKDGPVKLTLETAGLSSKVVVVPAAK